MTAEVITKKADAPCVFDVWIPFYVEIPDAEESSLPGSS
jgi:hypothetical protein